MLPASLRCALAVILIVTLAPAAHAAGKATVRGAASVNVRRGPSTDSPVVINLAKGAVVTVDKVIGDWALVTLASGRKGYVKAVFLGLPPGTEVVPVATPTAIPTPPVTPSALPTEPLASGPAATPEVHAEPARRDVLERELGHLRDRLAALESAVVTTPGSAATPARRESGEAAAPSEAPPGDGEPTRTAGLLLPSVAQPLEPQEIGPSLALAGVGLVIGFLLGAAYGQRQERRRRSRVRF